MLTILLLATATLAASDPLGAGLEGQRILQFPDGLNHVPMLGKKDTNSYPGDVGSFASSILLPVYGQIKRAAMPATWHLGKRAPWALERSYWVNNLFKQPSSNSDQGKRSLSAWTWTTSMDKNKKMPGKRTAIPNDWNSPWDHVLRSPQGFRFNEAGHDRLTRDLIYKRSPAPEPIHENLKDQQKDTDKDDTDQRESDDDSQMKNTSSEMYIQNEKQDEQPEVDSHKGIPPFSVEKQKITPNFWMVPPTSRFNPWVFDVMNAG